MLTCAVSQGGRVSERGREGSPAPGGREGLKEIVRGRDRERSEQKGVEQDKRNREQKEQDLRWRRSEELFQRTKAGGVAHWSSVAGTFLGEGQVEAPRGLDHGTEPWCGDSSSDPTKTQRWG